MTKYDFVILIRYHLCIVIICLNYSYHSVYIISDNRMERDLSPSPRFTFSYHSSTSERAKTPARKYFPSKKDPNVMSSSMISSYMSTYDGDGVQTEPDLF
jgi:hypothetical protein